MITLITIYRPLGQAGMSQLEGMQTGLQSLVVSSRDADDRSHACWRRTLATVVRRSCMSRRCCHPLHRLRDEVAFHAYHSRRHYISPLILAGKSNSKSFSCEHNVLKIICRSAYI